MRFGTVPVAEAEGALLAHSIKLEKGKLKKGLRLDAHHLDELSAAGLAQVTVARLDPGDVTEDAAAERLARALVGAPEGAEEAAGLRVTRPFTGRVNLLAGGPGVVVLDAGRIDAANRVDPMITIATVPAFQQLSEGGMAATIKIISYAVPDEAVTRACELAQGAMRLAPAVLQSASLIITEISGGPGRKGADAVIDRLARLDMTLAEERMVPHETAPLAEAVAAAPGDMVLILTGSATSDAHDVAPEALRRAGGRVEHFGMPVDPGNLLFLGELGGRPVIGLPGCARAPALNGADWVLSRLACGIAVTGADIAGMGVGGLLKEIPTRPMPRRGRKG
ncbi:molybdopterin biosynthesis protein [Aquicoccus sp. SCR17]|nr:molybdopterin biosynthesis protein [Carideicomes alvinocaridis]